MYSIECPKFVSNIGVIMSISKEELQKLLRVERGQISFDAEGNEGDP